MNKSEKIKLIHRLYKQLEYAFERHEKAGTGNYVTLICELEQEAEKGHRHFMQAGFDGNPQPPYRLSLKDTGKLFAVKLILEYHTQRLSVPDSTAILDLRTSVLYAAAIATRYKETVKAAIDPADVSLFFSEIDYIELIK